METIVKFVYKFMNFFEGLDNNEDVDNAVLKRESPEDIASVVGESKRLSRRSVSFF